VADTTRRALHLRSMNTGTLRARLALATSAYSYGQTPFARAVAADEIKVLRAELERRAAPP